MRDSCSAMVPAAAGGAQSGRAGAPAARVPVTVPVAAGYADFEVLHAGRVYPDGDAAALVREQLERVLRQAARLGLVVFVGPDGVRVVRAPEAAR